MWERVGTYSSQTRTLGKDSLAPAQPNTLTPQADLAR